MAYTVTGTPDNDTLNQARDTGPGTIVGLAGNDCLFAGSGFGRTYLAINQDAVFNAFNDAGDLLLDITGATGTIATASFI